MDKNFIKELAARHNVTTAAARHIYLDICRDMAERLAANQRQANPYFVIRPVSRAETTVTLPDGSEKMVKARQFGRMIIKPDVSPATSRKA